MYGFEKVGEVLLFFMVATLILLPFGIWKMVEIIIWLFNHVKIV